MNTEVLRTLIGREDIHKIAYIENGRVFYLYPGDTLPSSYSKSALTELAYFWLLDRNYTISLTASSRGTIVIATDFAGSHYIVDKEAAFDAYVEVIAEIIKDTQE